MERRMIRHERKYILCVGLLLGLLQVVAFSAARNGRTAESTGSQAASNRNKLRLEAQQSHKEIKALLTQVLELVQVNQRPSSELIEQCKTSLEENKQNALAYEDAQRADYMLLQAWTGYYQENMLDALNWSVRACRQYDPAQDAWISQAVFSMLGGKRPIEPRIEKPEAEQRSRPAVSRPRRNAEMTVEPVKRDPLSEKGVLEFDFMALRPEFFRERFERLDCTSTSGQTISYQPGQDTLCVFLFQSEQQVQPQIEPAETGDTGFGIAAGAGEYETAESDAPALGLDAQRQYFTMLMEACRSTETIKFLQVDTVRPRDLQSINTAEYSSSPIPTVIAADPQSNGRRFACDAHYPFMMIVDKSGAVKYSGPAGYFMPAFILSKTTGKEISLKPNASGDPLSQDSMQMSQRDPNSPAADPNAPQAPFTQVTAPPENRPAVNEYDFLTDDAEQQVTAENLLRIGQLKIEESITLRGASPEEGIKACRQVLEKYPNTPYAKQAQELLRRVPERYKQEYNITDEELGL